GAWRLLLGTAFFLNRGEDAGRLAVLLRGALGSLARERLVSASGLVAGAGVLFITALIVLAWFGLGDLLLRLGRGGRDSLEAAPRTLALASRCLFGAAAWSMVWLALGVTHLYHGWVAVAALITGVGLAGLARTRDRASRAAPPPFTAPARAAVALTGAVLGLALVAALAPPTARDALFYPVPPPKATVP